MDDEQVLAALRAGDEGAFRDLVEANHASMVRVALLYTPSRAVAEEVVQDTWMAVIQGLLRFEGRSSLKTWIFRILSNQARTRGERERRSVPFSSISDGPTGIEPHHFRPSSDRWPAHWVEAPKPWSDDVLERLEGAETRAVVMNAVRLLPPNQRDVITLRDVEGWTAEEVCATLGISLGNQRVLLHRARTRVRAALDRYFQDLVTT